MVEATNGDRVGVVLKRRECRIVNSSGASSDGRLNMAEVQVHRSWRLFLSFLSL